MGKFWKRYAGDYASIFKLGLPILIGQLGIIVVGFADNIMVGRYSTAALASASFVNNIFNIGMFVVIGFTYGVTPLVGALFTQKRSRDIGSLVKTALIINVLVALAVTSIMAILYAYIDRLGQPPELLPIIRPYYLTFLAGFLPVSLFNVFAQWSYAINNSKMPMWIILSANVLNVVGNYALIFGNFGAPELGLFGAGISTLCARVFCPAIIIAIFFLRPVYREYARGFRQGRPSLQQWRHVATTSWPVSAQMGLETAAYSGSAVMAGWLGAIPLAAFQVIVVVGTLGFCLYYSLGTAVSVMVANAAGKSDNQRMRHIAFAGYHLILLLAAVSSTLFIVFGRALCGVFTDDPLVLATAVSLLVPLLLYQIGDATQINFANALRGTSNVRPMMLTAFVSYLVVGLPSTYILAFPMGLGIYGIVLSFSVSLFTAGALFFYYFMRTTRKA